MQAGSPDGGAEGRSRTLHAAQQGQWPWLTGFPRAWSAPSPAELATRLSEKENEYAREFFVLSGSHLKTVAANHLPEAFNSLVGRAL